MKKHLCLVVIVFLVACLSIATYATPSMAEEKVYKWRMCNWGPRMPISTKIYHGFTEDVKRLSGGRLIIEDIYDGEGVPGSQVFNAVKDGLTEMGVAYMAYHSGDIPAGLAQTGLPGLTLSMEEVLMLYEFGWKEKLRGLYAAQNLFWLGDHVTGPTYMLTKNPIKSIDDLKGMKLRAVGANAKMVRNLGANPVSVPFAEIYTGLATGVFDGMAGSPLMDLSDGKFYELAKYLFPLKISMGINTPTFVNMEEWNKLPDDLKVVLEMASIKLSLDYRITFSMEELKKMDVMSAAGLQWGPEVSQADKQKWAAAARNIWPEYGKDKYSKELISIQAEFLKKIGQ